MHKLKHYQLRDGLLYFSPHQLEFTRLVVPRYDSLQVDILHDYHDDVIAGHMGMDKTYEGVQRDYYWPNMASDVRRYVETCDECQRNKAPTHAPYGLLNPLPIPTRNWEQVSMDFITQLPPTEDGYDSILVCVDKLSKMAHFIATHTTATAMDIAKLYIEHVFKYHGLPRVIISDRDSRFTAHFWKTLQKHLGTKLAMSMAYHPQTDGQTERTNRTLEQMLRNYTNYRQDNWDTLLPLIEFAYNDHVNASTKKTPFEANYGYHPNKPSAQFHMSKVPAADDMYTRIRNITFEITDHLAEAQIRQATNADESRQQETFNVGDYVLVNSDHIHADWERQRPTRKLGPKKLGPYRIIHKISDVAFKLELPPSIKVHPVFHASILEKYKPNPPEFRHRTPPRPPPVVIDDDPLANEYEVERILDDKMIRRKRHFLVKWKGYPIHESTWESEENLANAQRTITQYL